MSRLPAARRAERLQEISRKVGAVLNDFDPTPLQPIGQPPTFMIPDDERKADAILGQLRIEENSGKQSSRRISSAFSISKSPKQAVYSYSELYQGMVRVVGENGLAGVFEVLLKRFSAVNGNVNFTKRGSTSALKRVRGKEEHDERGYLLSRAAGVGRLDFVHLLVPFADEQSLHEAVDVAFTNHDLPIIELLVRYGADTTQFSKNFINAASHGDYQLLGILLRSRKRVSQQCLDQSLLPATAAPQGSLFCLLLLVWAGANADHDGALALMRAVEAEKVDLATALVIARNPPSGTSLNKALSCLFSQPSTPAPSTNGQYLLMEVLLCGGPVGDAASQGLLRATILANADMMQLLMSHQVDINFDNACAVGHAIQRNRSDLLGILLQGNHLRPDIACELVRHIPAKISSMDRVAIISKLLVNGASGRYCSEQLILAAESNDLDVAQILITYRNPNNGSQVCSVNYDGARCLKSAVSRNNIEMVKLLALEGDPSNLSLAQAFAAIQPNISGDDHFLVVQTLLRGGAAGLEVDEALHKAVMSRRKAHRLIELLVQFKADVREETLLAAISQGSTTILDILLTGGVSATVCATGISTAMKLPMTSARYKIIEKLLGPATSSNAEVPEVSQAVVDILENFPDDIDLLDLLCRQGKANINFKDGLPVLLATKQPNFTLLKILLTAGTFLPSSTTIEKAIECAINLPLTDTNRHKKIKALSWKIRPQGAINKALIQEIESAVKEGQFSPVIPSLLDVGADVNTEDGLPLRLAVSDTKLIDLLLSKSPSVHSMSLAFSAALALKDPARFMLCEKLLRAGASGDEVNKGLCIVVQDGPASISLLRLILPQADGNYDGGRALGLAVRSNFVEAVELILNPRTSVCSPATRTRAFEEAMNLQVEQQRLDMVSRVLAARVTKEVIDDALIQNVKQGDSNLKMIELLCKNGASVEWKEGDSVVIAVGSAMIQVIDLLLEQKPSQAVLRHAYAATSTLPKEQHLQVIERLLKAGKKIDPDVRRSFTMAVMKTPSDRQLIKMLLNRGVFDDGEAMAHAAKKFDLRTLSMLLNFPKATNYVSIAFEAVVINEELWKSATGLAVVKLLLEKGASGQAVAEALYQAVASLEHSAKGTESLANEFIDACLKSGVNVDYKHGLALQRATLQANIPLITKLLPGASSESKAMAMPYIFTVCDDKAAALEALTVFSESLDHEAEGLEIRFRHPDESLEPVLFLALNRFSRDTQILKFLLDMGYSANQWQFCASESDAELEKWPILCWALEQPEKKISSLVIEVLIEAGADVNYTSKSGVTPLWLAVRNQRVDIVSKLISRGVDVAVEDSEGITPLALASSMNNIALMERLLEADAERDDGSLHDVSRELELDKMRLLIKHQHSVNYPSDRHDGRSALAELCLKAVDHDPTVKQLEKGIELLLAGGAKIGQRNVSGMTIFHYALDSSNPILILTAMLKIFWEHINDDAFLYIDKQYTYSLTKYIEKNLSQGPPSQNTEILDLLRRKNAQDRFWAQDVMATQPPDYCNGPPHIIEEVIRQKQRLKRQAELLEETQHTLALKRLTAVGENDILQLSAQAEYTRMQEKSLLERNLAKAASMTQMRISEDAWSHTSRLTQQTHLQSLTHQRQIGDVQLSIAQKIKQESIEQERSTNMMQIEYLEKKIQVENEGVRGRKMIEEQAEEGLGRVRLKEHEREMARFRVQGQLLGQQQSLVGRFGPFGGVAGGDGGAGGFAGQRRIGFVSEVPN